MTAINGDKSGERVQEREQDDPLAPIVPGNQKANTTEQKKVMQ
jgi:hypothetical protein